MRANVKLRAQRGSLIVIIMQDSEFGCTFEMRYIVILDNVVSCYKVRKLAS